MKLLWKLLPCTTPHVTDEATLVRAASRDVSPAIDCHGESNQSSNISPQPTSRVSTTDTIHDSSADTALRVLKPTDDNIICHVLSEDCICKLSDSYLSSIADSACCLNYVPPLMQGAVDPSSFEGTCSLLRGKVRGLNGPRLFLRAQHCGPNVLTMFQCASIQHFAGRLRQELHKYPQHHPPHRTQPQNGRRSSSDGKLMTADGHALVHSMKPSVLGNSSTVAAITMLNVLSKQATSVLQVARDGTDAGSSLLSLTTSIPVHLTSPGDTGLDSSMDSAILEITCGFARDADCSLMPALALRYIRNSPESGVSTVDSSVARTNRLAVGVSATISGHDFHATRSWSVSERAVAFMRDLHAQHLSDTSATNISLSKASHGPVRYTSITELVCQKSLTPRISTEAAQHSCLGSTPFPPIKIRNSFGSSMAHSPETPFLSLKARTSSSAQEQACVTTQDRRSAESDLDDPAAQSCSMHVPAVHTSGLSKSGQARLLRSQAAMDELAVMATLMELDGQVLFQNQASIRFWGTLIPHDLQTPSLPWQMPQVTAAGGFGLSRSLLAKLFGSRQDLLSEMLQDVSQQFVWHCVLCVPAQLAYQQLAQDSLNFNPGDGSHGFSVNVPDGSGEHHSPCQPDSMFVAGHGIQTEKHTDRKRCSDGQQGPQHDGDCRVCMAGTMPDQACAGVRMPNDHTLIGPVEVSSKVGGYLLDTYGDRDAPVLYTSGTTPEQLKLLSPHTKMLDPLDTASVTCRFQHLPTIASIDTQASLSASLTSGQMQQQSMLTDRTISGAASPALPVTIQENAQHVTWPSTCRRPLIPMDLVCDPIGAGNTVAAAPLAATLIETQPVAEADVVARSSNHTIAGRGRSLTPQKAIPQHSVIGHLAGAAQLSRDSGPVSRREKSTAGSMLAVEPSMKVMTLMGRSATQGGTRTLAAADFMRASAGIPPTRSSSSLLGLASSSANQSPSHSNAAWASVPLPNPLHAQAQGLNLASQTYSGPFQSRSSKAGQRQVNGAVSVGRCIVSASARPSDNFLLESDHLQNRQAGGVLYATARGSTSSPPEGVIGEDNDLRTTPGTAMLLDALSFQFDCKSIMRSQTAPLQHGSSVQFTDMIVDDIDADTDVNNGMKAPSSYKARSDSITNLHSIAEQQLHLQQQNGRSQQQEPGGALPFEAQQQQQFIHSRCSSQQQQASRSCTPGGVSTSMSLSVLQQPVAEEDGASGGEEGVPGVVHQDGNVVNQQGQDVDDDDNDEVEDPEEEPSQTWHEVEVVPVVDPVTGSSLLLLLQTDISGRAQLEASMAALTDCQLSMLEQMFPRHVLEYMVDSHEAGRQGADMSSIANFHQGVTILFTDIVGFTSMSKEVAPTAVMSYLNDLFTSFDELVDLHGCYKVETAGDCYIAATGLMATDQDGFTALDSKPDVATAARQMLGFARDLLKIAHTVRMPHNGQPTVIRVGLHTGAIVTGLIGTKLPKFSLFGDTMNTASRMESTCPHGNIQISKVTYDVLGASASSGFRPTGGVEVKGIGRMDTYIWDPTVALESVEECQSNEDAHGDNMASFASEDDENMLIRTQDGQYLQREQDAGADGPRDLDTPHAARAGHMSRHGQAAADACHLGGPGVTTHAVLHGILSTKSLDGTAAPPSTTTLISAALLPTEPTAAMPQQGYMVLPGGGDAIPSSEVYSSFSLAKVSVHARGEGGGDKYDQGVQTPLLQSMPTSAATSRPQSPYRDGRQPYQHESSMASGHKANSVRWNLPHTSREFSARSSYRERESTSRLSVSQQRHDDGSRLDETEALQVRAARDGTSVRRRSDLPASMVPPSAFWAYTSRRRCSSVPGSRRSSDYGSNPTGVFNELAPFVAQSPQGHGSTKRRQRLSHVSQTSTSGTASSFIPRLTYRQAFLTLLLRDRHTSGNHAASQHDADRLNSGGSHGTRQRLSEAALVGLEDPLDTLPEGPAHVHNSGPMLAVEHSALLPSALRSQQPHASLPSSAPEPHIRRIMNDLARQQTFSVVSTRRRGLRRSVTTARMGLSPVGHAAAAPYRRQYSRSTCQLVLPGPNTPGRPDHDSSGGHSATRSVPTACMQLPPFPGQASSPGGAGPTFMFERPSSLNVSGHPMDAHRSIHSASQPVLPHAFPHSSVDAFVHSSGQSHATEPSRQTSQLFFLSTSPHASGIHDRCVGHSAGGAVMPAAGRLTSGPNTTVASNANNSRRARRRSESTSSIFQVMSLLKGIATSESTFDCN